MTEAAVSLALSYWVEFLITGFGLDQPGQCKHFGSKPVDYSLLNMPVSLRFFTFETKKESVFVHVCVLFLYINTLHVYI